MIKRVLPVVGLGLWLMSGCSAPAGELEVEGTPAVEALSSAPPPGGETTIGTTSSKDSESGIIRYCGECDYSTIKDGPFFQTCCTSVPVFDSHGRRIRVDTSCATVKCSDGYMELRLSK